MMRHHIALSLFIALLSMEARALTFPDASFPGGCRVDDETFSTEEGGCLDLSTALVWSSRTDAAISLSYEDARRRCSDLTEGNKSDWRLPTGAELQRAGSRPETAYHLNFGVSDFFWADASGSSEYAPMITLVNGESAIGTLASDRVAVVCARSALDVDRDGVPNSSDDCSATPAGSLVRTVAPRKGCADADVEFVIPGEHDSMKALCEGIARDERLCRRVAGCGWHRATGCLFASSPVCADLRAEWFCRTAPACAWNAGRCESANAK